MYKTAAILRSCQSPPSLHQLHTSSLGPGLWQEQKQSHPASVLYTLMIYDPGKSLCKLSQLSCDEPGTVGLEL